LDQSDVIGHSWLMFDLEYWYSNSAWPTDILSIRHINSTAR